MLGNHILEVLQWKQLPHKSSNGKKWKNESMNESKEIRLT
jgi:hypothetical protein